MLLREFCKYNNLIEYDHLTGKWATIPRSDKGIEERSSTNGFFSFLSGIFVASYWYQQNLFLRIGELCTPINENIVIVTTGPDAKRVLIVEKEGKQVAKIEYKVDESLKIPFSFTMSDEEDFDFGLYLSNISRDPSRWKKADGV